MHAVILKVFMVSPRLCVVVVFVGYTHMMNKCDKCSNLLTVTVKCMRQAGKSERLSVTSR